ncbi:hypothetical protein [[Phormidium] sp. ETS-05]|uniref:hypothetical protein n=1 Tax=[Phormidium] sp. ETS-05 TaxID=222819 RepID=UPI0018EED32C|nr:hypothetical protein [[Phormidium] sp. ETS-05]
MSWLHCFGCELRHIYLTWLNYRAQNGFHVASGGCQADIPPVETGKNCCRLGFVPQPNLPLERWGTAGKETGFLWGTSYLDGDSPQKPGF